MGGDHLGGSGDLSGDVPDGMGCAVPDGPAPDGRGPGRRAVLVGSAVVGVGLLAGTAAVATGSAGRAWSSLSRRLLDQGPDGVVPDVRQDVRLERVYSRARGREVGLFTAVPAGSATSGPDGRALPVCLVLHGASATTADFPAFGLGRFLTAAVRAGAAPFALVGVDGGVSRWTGARGDDPQAMLVEEVPQWCSERGLDPGRIAVHGWSMGGFGALVLAERGGLPLRAVAVFSPALSAGDEVEANVERLAGRRVGIWCGRSDPFFDRARALASAIPAGAAVASWGPGAHTRSYWNRVTPAAFAFVSQALAG